MAKLLGEMGVRVERSPDGQVALHAPAIKDPTASYELVKTMRASVLVLGPLLARCGRAKVSLPGGCAIGARPVDQHVKGLRGDGRDDRDRARLHACGRASGCAARASSWTSSPSPAPRT